MHQGLQLHLMFCVNKTNRDKDFGYSKTLNSDVCFTLQNKSVLYARAISTTVNSHFKVQACSDDCTEDKILFCNNRIVTCVRPLDMV